MYVLKWSKMKAVVYAIVKINTYYKCDKMAWLDNKIQSWMMSACSKTMYLFYFIINIFILYIIHISLLMKFILFKYTLVIYRCWKDSVTQVVECWTTALSSVRGNDTQSRVDTHFNLHWESKINITAWN